MNIYQESGYIDIRKIIQLGLPFNFIVGGRGTGKTYSSIKMVIEDGTKFIFMRRTQSQLDIINKPEFSPFKSINLDCGWNISTESLTKYNYGVYNMEQVEGKLVSSGSPIGYTCALSTISNLRGFDASDIDIWIYDEFIPEKHERPIKNEGSAFLNAYETINRNRELKGKKPLQVLALTNANDLANPIFMELGLVRRAEQMCRKNRESYIDREHGLALFILDKSPISEKKKDTALYRLTKGSNFEKMSIGNEFAGDEPGRINSRPLAEYKPIVAIGEICIYEHKANRSYYISTHTSGSPPYFSIGEADKARFRRMYAWVWNEYMENNIEFEEYLCEILLTKAFF